MTILELLIVIFLQIATCTFFFFVGKSKRTIIKPTFEELLKASIDKVELTNKLNPLVKQIYLQFIDKEKLLYFQYDDYDIKISNLEIEYWRANNEYTRHFRKVPIETLKELNLTLEELNGTLTQADRKVLDMIAKRVVKNNTEFINRLFI